LKGHTAWPNEPWLAKPSQIQFNLAAEEATCYQYTPTSPRHSIRDTPFTEDATGLTVHAVQLIDPHQHLPDGRVEQGNEAD
jgi:hypothetical protein